MSTSKPSLPTLRGWTSSPGLHQAHGPQDGSCLPGDRDGRTATWRKIKQEEQISPASPNVQAETREIPSAAFWKSSVCTHVFIFTSCTYEMMRFACITQHVISRI